MATSQAKSAAKQRAAAVAAVERDQSASLEHRLSNTTVDISLGEKKVFREAFDEIDVNMDGSIDAKELTQYVQRQGVKANVGAMIKQADVSIGAQCRHPYVELMLVGRRSTSLMARFLSKSSV